MNDLRFERLSPTEFENFCHDLLTELGYVNVNWRKGTGRDASPADSGRDLEADLVHRGVDGETFLEHWFIECKHHERGVPPQELQSVLTWAEAERPDRVLIIVSSFLSNPAKDYLKRYQENNSPRFRLSYWERPKLLELVRHKHSLIHTYALGSALPDLRHLHPLHQLYITAPPINTIDYFLDILDRLPPDERRYALEWVTTPVVNPRMRPPNHDKETMAELLMDPVDYSAFKHKCRNLDVFDGFLVQAIVSWVLSSLAKFKAPGEIDKIRRRHEDAMEYFGRRAEQEPDDNELFRSIVEKTEAWIAELPQRFAEGSHAYDFFCETVVAALLAEIPTISKS